MRSLSVIGLTAFCLGFVHPEFIEGSYAQQPASPQQDPMQAISQKASQQLYSDYGQCLYNVQVNKEAGQYLSGQLDLANKKITDLLPLQDKLKVANTTIDDFKLWIKSKNLTDDYEAFVKDRGSAKKEEPAK